MASSPSLRDILSVDEIRNLADPKSYSRGVTYADPSRITYIVELDGRLSATVHGSEDYHVELILFAGGKLGYYCTCPAAARLGFCKHCVALGLYYLEHEEAIDAATKRVDELRAKLIEMPRDQLANLIIDRTRHDVGLLDHLMGMSRTNEVLRLHRLVLGERYNGDLSFFSNRDIDRLSTLLEGTIDEVIEQMRRSPQSGLERASSLAADLIDTYYLYDDNDGRIYDQIDFLLEQHLNMIELAEPDIETLADQLFRMIRGDDWGLVRIENGYERLLKKKGMKKLWERVREEVAVRGDDTDIGFRNLVPLFKERGLIDSPDADDPPVELPTSAPEPPPAIEVEHEAEDDDDARVIELLQKNRADEAWQSAIEHGCGDRSWSILATRRSATHPEEAIGVWTELITSRLEEKRATSYAWAADMVEELTELMTRIDRTEELEEFLTDLREEHGRKRRFWKLVEERNRQTG